MSGERGDGRLAELRVQALKHIHRKSTRRRKSNINTSTKCHLESNLEGFATSKGQNKIRDGQFYPLMTLIIWIYFDFMAVELSKNAVIQHYCVFMTCNNS